MDYYEDGVDMRDTDTDIIALHSRLNEKHIFALKQRFLNEPDKKMEKSAFRIALCDIANIMYSDEEFQELFLKLDFARTRTNVSWEGFLTYLLLGFRSENLDKYSGKLYPPIKDAPKEFKSQHKMPICCITFVAELSQDRTVDYMLGNYITCSRDGRINYWSLDMEKKRSEMPKAENRKVHLTWITYLVALPDVEALCTCSTAQDLRFYDTAAKKFELRIVVTSFHYLINTMYYSFYTDPDKSSKLIIGDAGGGVHLISIISKNRGPFKNKLQNVEMTVTYDQFCKGAVPLMSIKKIPTLHTDWVGQVAYYENIHCTVSISHCSKQSMLIFNMKGKEAVYSFKVKKGFSCFSIAQTAHMIATGGPDCLVRMWNPFVTTRATTVFRGHHSEILSVVLQDDYKILVSLDEDKCIKVWDVLEQVCLQTYLNLPVSLNKSRMCTFYNPRTRQLVIASHIIVILQIYPLLDGEYTDGITHSKEVSVVLYNKLFQVVITCGYDSFIIVWNPFTGRRKEFIRDAHTTSMHGETHPVEITAAAFDPSEQFLITGASDGTLKVWKFNTGSCCRNLAIGKGVEICAIIWIKHRILVMGENRGITEFADDEDVGSSSFKCWTSRHMEDILCAIAHVPQILVTGSYGGEIIFWRLETGQAYNMFNVLNPSERIQAQFIKRDDNKKQVKSSGLSRTTSTGRKTYTQANPLLANMAALKRYTKDSNAFRRKIGERISINALTFLTTRTMSPKIGTVLAALDNGMIQIWSHHPTGGFITEYKATHSPTDYVVSMCTDEKNQYLFTGHMAGYIKTWHMINFGIPKEDHVHVCMPKIRLKFPFLLRDTLLGRAKRAHRDRKPLLVNSFKAHFKAVTDLLYIDVNEMIISCSSDGSARLWTLGGRYMGTLGTFKPWTTIHPGVPAHEDREFTIPADIQRTGSFTTLKVLTAGKDDRFLNRRQKGGKKKAAKKVDPKKLFGPDFEMKDILGKHFKLPIRHREHYHFQFDTDNVKKIPVFINIELPELTEIQRPPTPELIKQIRRQQEAINRR